MTGVNLENTGSVCSKVIVQTNITSGVHLVELPNNLEGQGQGYTVYRVLSPP